MLNSGGKNSCFARQKKINIRTLVVFEKNFLNETKNHNPPFKLNGWSLTVCISGEVVFYQPSDICFRPF